MSHNPSNFSAPDFLKRVREQLEADYIDTSERKIAADLKYRLLFITIQYLGYPYDVVGEFNLRQTYATSWRERLLKPYTLPPNSVPIFQDDPFKVRKRASALKNCDILFSFPPPHRLMCSSGVQTRARRLCSRL